MQNKFLLSLEEIARHAGLAHPSVVAWPDWMLYDEQHVPGIGLVLVPVAKFSSAVDISNRIADEAAAYVLRQKVGVR